MGTGQMRYALVELRSLVSCRGCPYVVPLHFAFQTPEYLYLALSYISYGDLSNSYKTQVDNWNDADNIQHNKL